MGDSYHHRTAQEAAGNMDPQGETEVKVMTQGGKMKFRRLDASNIKEGGKDIVHVLRPYKNGTAPKQERDAAQDIQKATGIKPNFVSVKPLPPKQEAPSSSDQSES